MEQQPLSKDLQAIEKFCAEQKIQIFYGSMDDSQSPDLCINSDENDWHPYLVALKAYDAKVLIISKEINDFEPDDDTKEYQKSLSGEDLAEYQRAVKIATNTRGELVFFVLNFFVGNISYQYRKHATWIEQYALALECFDIDDEDTDDGDRLPEPEIESLVRQVIAHPKYLKGEDRFERLRIGHSLAFIEDVSSPMDRYLILKKAEDLFTEEVLPGLEEELNKKIKSLKDSGHTKVAVKSKLQLTDTILNKHWY
jgi:hypothetical protein